MPSFPSELSQPLQWLDTQGAAMESLLIEWSSINSHTFNIAGLGRQFAAIEKQFSDLNGSLERIPLKAYSKINELGEFKEYALGDLMLLRKRPEAKLRFLLCGHMDTVFSESSTFQKPIVKENGIINGPGVIDMKGGLIIMLFALRAIESSALASQIGWDVIINSDEEIGSPGSAAILEHYALESNYGFVFEPSLDNMGTFASSRKGSGKFTLVVRGRTAHAGRNYHEGRNAIYGLAELLTAINKLNSQRNGVTINAGVITGGESLNVVPDLAICHIDIRINEASDAVWVHTEIQKVISKLEKIEGFQVELHGGFGRKPKPFEKPTADLFEVLEQVGEKFGLSIQLSHSGGCCDGNNLSAAGLPTIDTLGAYGGAIHTSNEFIILKSLVERAKLTTALLLTLATRGFK
jgi:glutamate carboxypeptidase